jgi:hypothetical protein
VYVIPDGYTFLSPYRAPNIDKYLILWHLEFGIPNAILVKGCQSVRVPKVKRITD